MSLFVLNHQSKIKILIMEIYKKTGVVGSGQILLTKGISALLIGFSKEYEDLTTEQINIEVERANGNNFEVTKGFMSLKDLILGSTYGEDAIVSDQARGLNLVAHCEIGAGAAIHLFEKDVIRIELKGLVSTETYVMNGIEEPETTAEIFSFESKSMGSEDKNKDFNVQNYDVLVMDKSDTIEELNFTFENGKVVKYTLFEVESMSKSFDPVAVVRANGIVKSSFSDKLQLPLAKVVNLNIRKSQGAVINLVLRDQI